MDAKVEVPVGERVKLSVRNLNFYYGGFQALKNICLLYTSPSPRDS